MGDTAEKSFNDQQRLDIQKAIAEAEKNTSGEIRLFIEDTCKDDVLDRAAFIFKELKMHETAERNGVLFYLAMKSQKFAILGDAGINEKVGNDFWNEIKRTMHKHFSTGEFTEGLGKGIRMAGEALSKHFPYKGGGDVNELSDEIVFGK
jgi:uncharacterized membrane protein